MTDYYLHSEPLVGLWIVWVQLGGSVGLAPWIALGKA